MSRSNPLASPVSLKRELTRRQLVIGAAAVAVSAAAAACAPSAAPASATVRPAATGPIGSFVWAKGVKARSVDPALYFGLDELQLNRQIFEPLVEIDAQGKLVGVLAEKWSVSEDAKTWTLNLRKDVKFHDGTAFDAQSVKATVERIKGNAKSGFAFIFDDFDNPPVDVVDPFTVRLKTKIPIASLLNNLSVVYMTPAEVADPKYRNDPWQKGIGSGPFKLQKFNMDGDSTLVANTTYWQQGLPKAASVVYRPIAEESAMVSAFKAGEVDLVEGVPEDLIPIAQSVPGSQIVRAPAWEVEFLVLNQSGNVPALQDPKVRQAINYAIDRDTLVKGVLGVGAPLASYPPKGILGFSEKIPANPYDPAKAKELLAQSRFPNGFDVTVTVPQGKYTRGTEVCQFVVDQLNKVGIRAKLSVQEASSTLTGYRQGKYEIGYLGSVAMTGDADRYFTERMVTDILKTGYKNPEVTKMIGDAAGSLDAAKRQSLYEQVQQKLWEGPPVVYLYQTTWTYAVNSKISGFHGMPSHIYPLYDVAVR